MTDYEAARDARMAANRAMLLKLGIPDTATSIRDAWRPAHARGAGGGGTKRKKAAPIDPALARRSGRHEVGNEQKLEKTVSGLRTCGCYALTLHFQVNSKAISLPSTSGGKI